MVWIVLIIIVLLILYAISVYNSLVGLKQKVKNGAKLMYNYKEDLI